MTVESPHSQNPEGHYYFKLSDEFPSKSPEWGDIQSEGSLVVGPGSILTNCQDDCCNQESPGQYKILHEKPIQAVKADELRDILSLTETETPDSTPQEGHSSPVNHYHPKEALGIENDMGYPLREIKEFSPKLDSLLSNIYHRGYPSPSEADLATMRILYRYRFSDRDIFRIIRAWRKREKVLERMDYLNRTLRVAKRGIQPMPKWELSNTVRAYKSYDKRAMRMKPIAGIQTKNEVIEAIRQCPKEPFKVSELVDSRLIDWNGQDREAVMRRTRRGLKSLSPWFVQDVSDNNIGEWITMDNFEELDVLS